MKAWKSAEARIAKLLGGTRLFRIGYSDSQPDATGKKGGFTFIIESKHRKKLPKFLTKTLDQAKQHTKKNQIYIAYFHEKNAKRGIVALEDTQFAKILEARINDKKNT